MNPTAENPVGLARLACALLAIAASSLAQAGGGPATVERTVYAMGTSLRLRVEAADRATALGASEALLRAVDRVEERLSVWREGSEISRSNAAPPGVVVRISETTAADLRWAFSFGREFGGAFDVTAGPLIEAYGLRAEPRWPTEEDLRSAREAVGSTRFLVSPGGIVRLRAGARLDCDGFAKGLGLDRGLEAALAAGGRSVFCDFGGQVVLAGADAIPVEIAIADPFDRRRTVRTLRLPPGFSAATSGNGERRVEVEGRAMGHLIDPRSGLPAPDFGSVTTLARSAAAADAAATGLFVLGPERGLALARRLSLSAVFVVRDPDGGCQVLSTMQ